MTHALPLTLLALLALSACASPLPERLVASCVTEAACGDFPDYDACLRAHPRGTLGTPLAATYDRGVDEDCFRTLQAHGCYRRGVPHPSCPSPYVGLVAEGGACRDAAECAPGTYCDLTGCTTECCSGECVAVPVFPPRDPLGATCVPYSCVDGATCSGGVCVAKGAEHAPCSVSEDCLPPLLCAAGACAPLGAVGDACDEQHLCEPSSEFCAPDGRCAADLPLGATCDDARPCVGYAACVSGTCVRRGDVGEPCTNGCYISLRCEAGVCTPAHPPVDCP